MKRRLKKAPASLWQGLKREIGHSLAWLRYGRARWPDMRVWFVKTRRRNLRMVIGAMIAVVVAFCGWRYYEYRSLYNQYYDYFYAAYLPKQGKEKADRYASHYAAFYATYYLSEDYRHSVGEALPDAKQAVTYAVKRKENKPLRISGAGLALVKQFEGLQTEPYLDVGGKLTIGYGHLVKRGEMFGSITEAMAEDLLREDIASAEAVVKRYVQVPVSQPQFDALVSLAFNIGERQFRTSTLLRLLNKNRIQEAAQEFLRWKHVDGEVVKGLVNRRRKEYALFISGS